MNSFLIFSLPCRQDWILSNQSCLLMWFGGSLKLTIQSTPANSTIMIFIVSIIPYWTTFFILTVELVFVKYYLWNVWYVLQGMVTYLSRVIWYINSKAKYMKSFSFTASFKHKCYFLWSTEAFHVVLPGMETFIWLLMSQGFIN